MRRDIQLEKDDQVYISTEHGGTWHVTTVPFPFGYGIRVEPIGTSYIPICKALAERDDLIKEQKEIKD